MWWKTQRVKAVLSGPGDVALKRHKCLNTCSLNQSSLMPLKSNTSPSSTGNKSTTIYSDF